MKLLAQMQAPWLGSMESGAEGAGWGGVLCPGCLVTGYTHSPREPALESPPSHFSQVFDQHFRNTAMGKALAGRRVGA